MGTDGGVYFTTNNGATWIAVNNGLSDSDILSLAVIGKDIFAGTNGFGVWKCPISEIINSVNEF